MNEVHKRTKKALNKNPLKEANRQAKESCPIANSRLTGDSCREVLLKRIQYHRAVEVNFNTISDKWATMYLSDKMGLLEISSLITLCAMKRNDPSLTSLAYTTDEDFEKLSNEMLLEAVIGIASRSTTFSRSYYERDGSLSKY